MGDFGGAVRHRLSGGQQQTCSALARALVFETRTRVDWTNRWGPGQTAARNLCSLKSRIWRMNWGITVFTDHDQTEALGRCPTAWRCFENGRIQQAGPKPDLRTEEPEN